MRKKSSVCEINHLELRRLLSTIFGPANAPSSAPAESPFVSAMMSTIFVDASAPGLTHNGTSWATAFTSLQQALSAATDDTVIKVGAGTYTPTAGSSRTATFLLADGVTIDGGFAGTGASNPDARDPATFPTILSGDIGTLGDNTDNSYHVVTGSSTDSTAVLDGFTITDGNANGNVNHEDGGGGVLNVTGSPTINDCTITGNTAENGGGMDNYNGSLPAISNCTVSGNTADQRGGGIYTEGGSPSLTNSTISGNMALESGGGLYNNYNSSPALVNCIISGNAAQDDGGGILNIARSSPTLVNCTLSGNTSQQAGGGMINALNSFPVLTNTILWGDTAPATNEIGDGTTVTFSDIDESGFTNTGDIDVDPKFMRAVGTNGASDFGDLHLQSASPAINIGSNAADSNIATDLDGNPRIVNGVVDMGAYESQTAQPIFVDRSATGLDNGNSWANAFTSLQTALGAVTAGATLDVAQGVYKPTTGTDRTATFELQTGVIIDGGFAGDSTSNPGQRDVSQFVTTLSGDIGALGNKSDNSYNVVTADAIGNTAILDGFTITGGNADDGGDVFGGGILDNTKDSSPTINNCIVTGNTASNGGGVTFYYSSAAMTDCTITGNTTVGAGGGIITDNSDATLTDCTITGNTATAGGAGLVNIYASPTLINCIISGNTTVGNGGGIFNKGPSLTLTNCTISGNTAAVGGGLYTLSTSATASSTTVTNSIFWSNTATTYNEIGIGPNSTVTITFSDINQNGVASTGDIDTDPMFIRNPGTNGVNDFGDLHLRGDSPAINAGSNAAISGTTTDLADNSRIIAGTVDMGVFESTATQLVMATQPPAHTAPGSALSIVVDVDDQNGNIVNTDNSTVVAHIATGPTGTSLGGTFMATAQNGIATFNALSLSVEGNYTLSFSDDSLTGATSSSFTIGLPVPTSLTITQQPTNTAAGQTLPAINVEVKDQFGNLIDGSSVNVALTSDASGATLDGTAILATSAGVASFSNLALDQAGTYTLVFSDGSLPGITSSSFTINAAAMAKLVFVTEPANATAGQTLSTGVEVEDQFGNPTDDSSVTLAVGSGPSEATLDGTLVVPTVNGVAAFSNLTLDRAGTFTLSASDGNLPTITTSSFAITYAGPQLVFTAEPISTTAGTKLAAVKVDPEDTSGNPLTSNKSKIKLTLSSGGKLLGTTTAAVKNGVAMFSNLSIQKAGTYTLTASDPSFAGAQSTTFTIGAAAAAKMAFTPQPANVAHGAPFNVNVELFDRYGNLATNNNSTVELTLGSHPHGATLSNLMAAVTNGSVDFDVPALTMPGNYTLDAIDGKIKTASKKFAVG